MSDLHLDSLEIKNFRCFEHLVIEKLGRVNLIVGRNSVGKTSLLEAIRLYATKALPHDFFLLLLSRGSVNAQDSNQNVTFEHLNSLFWGRNKKIGNTIKIGKANNENNTLSIQSVYCVDDLENPPRIKEISPDVASQIDEAKLGIKVALGGTNGRIFKLPLSGHFNVQTYIHHYPISNCEFISSNGSNPASTPTYWDQVILDNQESSVIELLKSIDNSIERIYMLATPDSPYGRAAFVKTQKFDKPFLLTDLGEGIMRTFGLALFIAKSRNGFLLIDEFENGLHHGIQIGIWKHIFRLAKETNIQVFATTHSWDCVEAFQEAAAENQDEEAMLISLQQRKAGIQAVLFDKDELKVVTHGHIEVR